MRVDKIDRISGAFRRIDIRKLTVEPPGSQDIFDWERNITEVDRREMKRFIYKEEKHAFERPPVSLTFLENAARLKIILPDVEIALNERQIQEKLVRDLNREQLEIFSATRINLPPLFAAFKALYPHKPEYTQMKEENWKEEMNFLREQIGGGVSQSPAEALSWFKLFDNKRFQELNLNEKHVWPLVELISQFEPTDLKTFQYYAYLRILLGGKWEHAINRSQLKQGWQSLHKIDTSNVWFTMTAFNLAILSADELDFNQSGFRLVKRSEERSIIDMPESRRF